MRFAINKIIPAKHPNSNYILDQVYGSLLRINVVDRWYGSMVWIDVMDQCCGSMLWINVLDQLYGFWGGFRGGFWDGFWDEFWDGFWWGSDGIEAGPRAYFAKLYMLRRAAGGAANGAAGGAANPAARPPCGDTVLDSFLTTIRTLYRETLLGNRRKNSNKCITTIANKTPDKGQPSLTPLTISKDDIVAR